MSNDNQGNATPKFLTVSQVAETLVFALGNGKQLVLDTAKVPDAMKTAAMYHGLNQKVRDSAAGYSKGNQFSEAYAEMADVIESIYAGSWNRGRTGVGAKVELLAEAIARIKKVPVEKALAAVQKATDEQRAQWLKTDAVKQAIAAITAERLKKAGVNAEEVDIQID